MPPQLSDDERSESEVRDAPKAVAAPADYKVKSKQVTMEDEEEESLMIESGGNGEDEDDEIGEDEYVVEAITNHAVDEDGQLFFEVKWEGFEKKSDRTMEPEENLAESASEILTQYLERIGGREALLEAWEEKKQAARKGKKRARSSTETNGTSGVKRGRKTHPASTTPPASAKNAEFKPPSGSWEDEITGIDACEGAEGSVVVYLTWKGGQKSQHPLAQVYKRCPQRMLRFYESHLVFKKNDD